MARLSSASTESDYVPAMVPFHWEVAPGRPAVPEILDPPSLPLPPGKRPKDGFYLPYSRPAKSLPLHYEAGGMNSSSWEKRSFNLRFPRSSKKLAFFSSQKPRKIRDIGRVEDTHVDGIFRHVSGHRFGSRITRRVLVEFQKRRSCLGGCWSHGLQSSLSHNHHHTGRRLDSTDDSNEEEIQKPSPTPIHSAASGSTLSSASSQGQGHPSNSSVAGARKQPQVQSQGLRSSRFMASMLLSLCLADRSDERPNEEEAVDTGNEIINDVGDSFSIDLDKLAMPRSLVSSPEAFFQAPHKGIGVDPASPTVASHEERTRAWVNLSTDMPRCNMSEQLHKEPPTANMHCEYCGGTKLLQPIRVSLGTEEFTNKSDQNFAFQHNYNGDVADVHSVSSTEASHYREVRPRPTRESCTSSFSWKPRNQIRTDQQDHSSNGTPTAVPSLLQRNSLEEELAPNQPTTSRPISGSPRPLLQNQAQVTVPRDSRIKDNLKGRISTSTVWLEALRSSPLWPNPAPKTSSHAGANDNSDDESGNESDICSTVSSEHETSRAVSQTPSSVTPVLCNVNPPPKPATWEISEELLKSSSLLKCKQQRQDNHESPRSSFMVERESTLLLSPNYDSKGADPAIVPAGSLSETSKLNCSVMSKVAQWESKAGVGSSGKSLPIYLTRRRGITISGKAVSRYSLERNRYATGTSVAIDASSTTTTC